MQNPEGHRETLHEMSAALQAEGLIDPLEQFDMNEMANAAYWHAVEELQNSLGQYRGASTYDVVHVDDGKLLATINRSVFNFATEKPRGASRTYDGKVYSGPDGIRLDLGICRNVGTISGLILAMHGQRYLLVETERMIAGISHHPLSDADAYRALIDLAQIAKEDQDLRAFQKLRPHIESSMFKECLTCSDHFAAREECIACSGLGFVLKISSKAYTKS